MPQWLRQVPEVVVGDLIATKRTLVDVPAETTIAQTLTVLHDHRILSCPVFGKKGAWIGAGGVDLHIGDKQYIGIVSLIDILAFMFRNEAMTLRERLSTPIVQVVGQSDESLCLWVEPANRPLLYACEMLGKGVHRALVTDGSTVRLLTQTDVVKFIATHSQALPHLTELFTKPVRDVAQAARPESKHNVLYVELNDSLKMALSMLLEHKITALPVLDGDGSLRTQLSISDFRGVLSACLADLQPMTVQEYLIQTHNGLPAPIVCADTDNVGQAVHKMLANRVHRIWVIMSSRNNSLSLLTFTDVIAAAFQRGI